MLRLRDALAGVLVASALGCSPVKDNSNVPDAAVDATDSRPPMIASSIPEHMSGRAAILAPISVYFDEELDPASVTAATVKLGYEQRIPYSYFNGFDILKTHGPITAGLTPVPGTVSYTAGAKKVSFVPTAPLLYGSAYTLSLEVKDTAGLAFSGSVSFVSYVNGPTRQHFYNATTGVPTSWLGQPTDMAGRQAKRLSGSSPGTDAQWFTADDPSNEHYGFSFSPDGRLLDERRHAQGTDGLYNTPDDVVNICVRYSYDAMRHNTERTYATAAGPDAMLCTMDDVPVVNTKYEYMGSTLTGWVYYTSAGTDATWRTPDDRCDYYYDYEYDASGRKKRDTMRQCGPDSLPRTADDTNLYVWYHDYEYDADGNLTKQSWRTGPGTDTIWLNTDDDYNQLLRYTRDAAGLVTSSHSSSGPGTDGMWGTADDPGTRVVNTYNAQKLVEDATTYSAPGVDTMWGTPDDVISSYTTWTHDANGNRISQKLYVAGPDGMWKTADDRLTNQWSFDLSK